MQYLITVKLPKYSKHDPKNKITGACPVTGLPCTDVTGQHHTLLYVSSLPAERVAEVAAQWDGAHHVTRVEQIG